MSSIRQGGAFRDHNVPVTTGHQVQAPMAFRAAGKNDLRLAGRPKHARRDSPAPPRRCPEKESLASLADKISASVEDRSDRRRHAIGRIPAAQEEASPAIRRPCRHRHASSTLSRAAKDPGEPGSFRLGRLTQPARRHLQHRNGSLRVHDLIAHRR